MKNSVYPKLKFKKGRWTAMWKHWWYGNRGCCSSDSLWVCIMWFFNFKNYKKIKSTLNKIIKNEQECHLKEIQKIYYDKKHKDEPTIIKNNRWA